MGKIFLNLRGSSKNVIMGLIILHFFYYYFFNIAAFLVEATTQISASDL